MSENEHNKNADRFKGFADVYESARPVVPERFISLISTYIGHTPETVVDLGCGTGLSTAAWRDSCKRAVGIEPSSDMLAVARQKETEQLSFRQAFSDNTGLPDNFADAVVCSQSFHWMEPNSTLAEVNRILKSGGVFATVDCDWPPVMGLEAEKAYTELFDRVRKIEEETKDISATFRRWEKSGHLKNIRSSGHFGYCREIVFESGFRCNADRLIALAQSQGSLQTILRLHPELIEREYRIFCGRVRSCFPDEEAEISLCYRVRLGVKSPAGT